MIEIASSRAAQSHAFLQHRSIHAQWLSDYLAPDMDAFYDAAFAEIVRLARIKASDRVLDAGCGYCFHAARLARSGARITGVDFSGPALDAGKEFLGRSALQDRVKLVQSDLASLPFDAETFDHIACWGVLMHIPSIESTLIELARVLKPGGRLIICETNMRAPDIAVRERFIRIVKRAIRRGPTPEVRRTPHGLEVWTTTADGGLLVRKTDMRYLRLFLEGIGMQQTARIAGQLTEAYTNVPLRSLKRAIYGLNRLYFRRGWPAALAASSICFFVKSPRLTRPD